MKFRSSLLVSVCIHLSAAGLFFLGMGGRLPWREEMVIDLTGSFQTRAPASMLEKDGNGKRAINKSDTEKDSGKAVTGIDEGGQDPESPIFDITSLPELKERNELKDKLARYYPPEARRNGEEGVVLMEVVVSSSGKITRSKVIKSDPAIFAESAVKICSELVFTPAFLGNRAVAVRIRIPIRFELEK